MLCWRFTIHNTLSNICCVRGTCTRCSVVGLAYTTHFHIYVLLEVDVVLGGVTLSNMLCWEVKHVVLEVYHTQHTFKICCV